MKKQILFIAGGLLVGMMGVGIYLWSQAEENSPNQDESQVRSVVENFGNRLQSVSLLAPQEQLEASMQEYYADYVAQELIQEWMNNPENVPGRLTSSPSPDRIEIDSVQRENDTLYHVQGRIIELTSVERTEGGTAAERNIQLTVEKRNEGWLITNVTLGGYTNNSNWKTFIDEEDGITFQYPEELPTNYIMTQEWPPRVDARIAQFLCAESLQEISGREYCIGSESGGAAGSVYTSYTYNTMQGDRMITVQFALRYPQCANYAEPEQTACEVEQEAFNVDALADQIVDTVTVQ